MKKLALALVAATTVAGAASANIGTGVYLGAAVGYGATTAKETGATTVGAVNGVGRFGSKDVGGNAANFGLHVGYGWVQSCLYFGGELAYTFENAKINSSISANNTTNGNMVLKRNGYFRAALRAGYLISPTTMLYATLGTNWGKWTLRDSQNFNGFSNTNQAGGSKNRLSFAPGLGLERALTKNVYLRVEYVYEFGPSVRATSNAAAVVNNQTNMGTIRSQSAKLGLSYKF